MPLPFDLPSLSRGFAAVTPAACATGARAAGAAASALAALLGREVTVHGRACPGVPAPRAVAARVGLELTALPAAAALEVDPGLVVAVVAALAGGAGGDLGASALTPVERAALDLFALAALEGACGVPEVEDRLAPRLCLDAGGSPPSALAVELAVLAGPASGRARLLLPPAAVTALRGPAPGAAAGTRVPVSVRSGAASLSPDELAALAAGDVVLLDPPADCEGAVVLPGGARIRGRIEEGALRVAEVVMEDRAAQLPIRLELELARVELPLSELARLAPGSVLPLSLDRRGLVTLRVGERAIGRGELVDVEGAVGVRVLGLEGSP